MNLEKPETHQRLIVIDDDPVYRTLLLQAAQNEGLELDTYESLMDLGSIGLLGRYDAAIVDFDLGSLNGVEIAEYLSALFGDIPMVLVSATERMPDQEHGWPSSIKTFVNKSTGPIYALAEAVRLAELENRRPRIAC